MVSSSPLRWGAGTRPGHRDVSWRRFPGRRVWILLTCLVCGFAGRTVQAAPHDQAPALVVVVNRSVAVDTLTQTDLQELVLGRQRFWKSGQRVELVVRGHASRARQYFVETLSGMTELQFQQYWIGQVFKTRATSAPRAVPDRRTVLALVSVLPGALAIVEDGPLPPNVKVVTIEDTAPPRAPVR